MLNSSYLTEVIRRELIIKKCSPVLFFGISGVSINNCDTCTLIE